MYICKIKIIKPSRIKVNEVVRTRLVHICDGVTVIYCVEKKSNHPPYGNRLAYSVSQVVKYSSGRFSLRSSYIIEHSSSWCECLDLVMLFTTTQKERVLNNVELQYKRLKILSR